MTFYFAISIFFIAYALICFETFHKTIIALVGAGILLLVGVLTQTDAFHSEEFGVDWNVVFLLISMMIIVNVMKPTGFFEYLAIKSAKLAKGSPYGIMAIFAVVTAVLSAFIDNVTTVLLITPIIIFICDELEVNAIPYLIATCLASNIGGTATLIGDPPNIMIASKANFVFMDFVIHLGPVVLVIMFVYVVMLKIIFRKDLKTSREAQERIMQLDESGVIKEPATIIKCLIVLGGVIGGFVFHGVLHLQPATIALFGAGALLLIVKVEDLHPVLAEVEWSSIFFFIGLFIIVGAVVKVGFIQILATMVVKATGNDMLTASTVILWFSAVASAIIDNIPFVATMNPLIINMGKQLWPQMSPEITNYGQLMPVWWALSLGACLGGNGTAIGASANVIVVGMAEKAGKKISFTKFMIYAFPFWLMSLIISNIYIWFRYFVLR
ncbi:MAG: putative tyrosine transporter P-protein [Deltaproteobacteria bacterium]|nr:putative tyrosine transporter P-protein [Deltaproteobacteria bacterium]